ncbi:hypothetical protein C8Q79DRAFT_775077 [Trametes meyenii]|nr:hypothetical protein C8Q79DRAFT_775077 [Trametes meyenii]
METHQSPPSSPHPQTQTPILHLTRKLVGHHVREDHAPSSAASPLHSGSGTSPFVSSGHGSSSSKPPHLLSPDSASPSSLSKTQSPDPLDTFSKVSNPPFSPPEGVDIQMISAKSVIANPIPDGPDESLAGPQEQPKPATSSTSPSSESEGHVGPTRASIRAWVEATPSGPPRETSSPASFALPQSESDGNSDRLSITRSASRPGVVSHSSFGSASCTSGDENGRPPLGRNVPEYGSSGNVADGESSGSEQVFASPLGPSAPSSPPRELDSPFDRETLAPHPHPHAQTHHCPPNCSPLQAYAQLHPNSPNRHPSRPPIVSKSSSESASPNMIPGHSHAHAHGPPDRLERRPHRQHTRRRHRGERDRDHAGRARTSSHPTIPVALTPLPFLPPPPAPLSPLRPLQVSSGGGMDVFEEIGKMLVTARRPLLRVDGGAQNEGWVPLGRPRENDVLDDICRMIVMSREG